MISKHYHKILVCVLALLFTAGTTFSQVAFGTKAGVNFSNVKISNDGIDSKSKTDLNLGLFLELPITQGFYIQPEVTYMGRGYKTDILSIENTYNIAYLDVGALAKLRFGDEVGFYLGAGPFFSYALSGQIKNDQGKVDLDFDAEGYKRTDFTLATAVGIEFGRRDAMRFFADVRYLMGLSDQSDNEINNYTVKNRVIGLNGGIIIPLGQ